MKVGVVVPAAGRGTRFGNAENKIWAKIGPKTILEWTLAAFEQHPQVAAIVLVGALEDMPRLRETVRRFRKVCSVEEGGATRQESVGNGVRALPQACDIALVHDAARPAVSQTLISRVIEETARFGSAIPGYPISDTIKRVDSQQWVVENVAREGLWVVQTPQGARTADLLLAYERLGSRVAQATDEAGVLQAAGFTVRMVEGEEQNIKVTMPGDLQRAAQILEPTFREPPPAPPETRTGLGYDVHPFQEGRPLWLGGVPIPHTRGLAGHSDADVLLHAVCDALLGAAGMGDIGVLFPDTDNRHKDRPSLEFVQEVRRRLAEAGWRVVHVDVSLLAEEPRIGPFRDRMREAISRSLEIAPDRVNLKATTSEKMGFIGRREGIACWAVATITK
jgi:2-C-methyl-D-erythritol 4-phosphate cytidylyltransferase/2-C-methyl-D-erythritol 2,4-cyclodiphosphate synthase